MKSEGKRKTNQRDSASEIYRVALTFGIFKTDQGLLG